MGETITLTAADGHTLSAWRTGPAMAARALVVAQEIFGVNAHIRAVCERFAARDFAVIAPALFDRARRGVELGYTAADIAAGRALRAEVAEAGTIADIEAAAAALPEGAKRGIVGYCWGGTVAWWGATRTSRFSAAACWYGGGIAATRTELPRCPVQMHFGGEDASIPMADVDAIRAAQPGVEVFVYPGAQHGFGCEERASFSAPARDHAHTRTLGFLVRHLI